MHCNASFHTQFDNVSRTNSMCRIMTHSIHSQSHLHILCYRTLITCVAYELNALSNHDAFNSHAKSPSQTPLQNFNGMRRARTQCVMYTSPLNTQAMSPKKLRYRILIGCVAHEFNAPCKHHLSIHSYRALIGCVAHELNASCKHHL